jgi:hypothetical protein
MRRFAAIVAAAAAVLASASAAAGERAAVVELFTSQGCNSCPPADAMLGQLAKRKDVIAFSFHVDYWDYLGWKDTFASPENTNRQRAYARATGRRTIYTPEMVVGGDTHVVGSDGGAIERAIAKANANAKDRFDITFARDNADYVMVTVSADESVRGRAAVLLFRYDTRHEVAIERGENAVKKLAYHNVVREVRRLDTWRGETLQLMLPVRDLRAGGRDGCAVVVQREHDGPILGAAKIALND